MIELFSHGSPNGHKITIALEELELPYETTVVDVFAGEGQAPWFLELNPTGKIPVIRDRTNGVVVTESNAILLYLADKVRRLVPDSGVERTRAIELLFLQASLVGPMFGQRSHFSLFTNETVPYGIRRYEEQGETIDALVNRLLSDRDYFLASGYSIVDVAFIGWYHAAHQRFPFNQHRHLQAWFDRVMARPAVRKGVTRPSGLPNLPARKVL
jgi:GSH-dependent disulfide-bond oxidoreductase